VTPTGSRTVEPFVLLGTITRPHGIRGELKVRPFTEKPENLGHYRCLYLAADDVAPKVAFTNEQTRVSGNSVIVRLKECADRNRAEELAGMLIWVPASNLPPVSEGEFYLHTLEGKRATTLDGQDLGRVVALITGGSQNILVIRNDGEEVLVPVVRTFIVSIGEGEVVLDLPPGLLKLNQGSGKRE
jgi:16S rRNA processing protein RimM